MAVPVYTYTSSKYGVPFASIQQHLLSFVFSWWLPIRLWWDAITEQFKNVCPCVFAKDAARVPHLVLYPFTDWMGWGAWCFVVLYIFYLSFIDSLQRCFPPSFGSLWMLVKSSLSGFRIPLCAIGILFRKSLPVSLFPLAVTALMWSYFIHFGLIFVQNNIWIWLHSFVRGCPVCPAPFVRLDCLSCMFWHYWKFSSYNNMNLFLGLLFYCIVHMSVLVPMS